jgi:uncharacterized protein YkwD
MLAAAIVLATAAPASGPVRQPEELRSLERETLRAVNDVRVRHGLPSLATQQTLTEIARAHSRDMALRDYFGHHSPEGANAADRVQRRGIDFSRLGENLHKSLGAEDAVRTAVDSWLASERHRETMLTAGFRETGVGVAVDDEGALYFTQLFLTPLEP